MHWAATWCGLCHQGHDEGEEGGLGTATLCKTSSAPLDTIPATLQCTRDIHTESAAAAMTNRRSNRETPRALSCDVAIENEVCVVALQLQLRFRSRRNHSVTSLSLALSAWTVSQSSRLYIYIYITITLPRRCYKLQASSHLPRPCCLLPPPLYQADKEQLFGGSIPWNMLENL